MVMLGIGYKGVTFPVVWMLWGKKGNSNTKERKQLVARFLDLMAAKDIALRVADRELIGQDWFKCLGRHKIPFTFRIRQDAADANQRGTVLVKGLKGGPSQVLTQAKS